MRLREETKLMVLSLIGILIITTTMGIQHSDSQIYDYNNEITYGLTELNHYLIHNINLGQDYFRFELYDLNDNIQLVPSEVLDPQYGMADENYMTIQNDFLNGNITQDEYILEMKTYFYQSQGEASKGYMKTYEDLSDKITQGTRWKNIKDILIVFQIALIIFSLIGYLFLYRQIKKRT